MEYPMMSVAVNPGDVVLTNLPGILGSAINKAQSFWSPLTVDASTSHAAYVIDSDGSTLEALWTVKRRNVYALSQQMPLIIARHDCMNPATFEKSWASIKDYEGTRYPFYRLVYHLLPPVSKLADKWLVCSELVARALYEVELCPVYNGMNPHELHMLVCMGAGWKVVWDSRYAKCF